MAIQSYPAIPARYHGISSEDRTRTRNNTGGGSAVLLSKSPRMRVNYAQLDHYLEFITSPHAVIDLRFGQRLLSLADGSVLETSNLI